MGEAERQIDDSEILSSRLTSDELLNQYVKIWNMAHRSREHGNESLALETFYAAYSHLDKVEETLKHERVKAARGFEGDWETDPTGEPALETKWLDLAYKRAGCLDSILVSRTALRREPADMVAIIHMNTESLTKMLDYVLPDSEEESSIDILVDRLQRVMPASVEDVENFERDLTEIYEYIISLDNLTNLKWAQLFFFYITRWAYNVRDYFQKASAQKQLFKAFEDLSKKAAVFGQHIRTMVEDRIGEKDAYDNKISGQTKWLQLYPVIQRVQNKEGDFHGAIRAYEQIHDPLAELEQSEDYGNQEYAFKIKTSYAYASACLNIDDYPKLHELDEEVPESFPRIKVQIKIAKIRACLRHGNIAKAERILEEAEGMKSSMVPTERTDSDGELKVLRAHIDLFNYKDDTVLNERSGTDIAVGGVLSDLMDDTGVHHKARLLELSRIESNFPKESLQEIRIKRQEVPDLLLEAERCFVLGKIETERVKINMNDYARKNFERARTYLLTAYSILLEYGYGYAASEEEAIQLEAEGREAKDTKLYVDIERAYKELIDLNNQITGIGENQRRKILEDIDMQSTVHFFQLEEWGRDFDQLSDENLEEKLFDVIRRFAPVSEIKLVKAHDVPKLSPAMQSAHALNLSATNEFAGYNSYADFSEEGKKYIAVLPLDTCEQHCIFIESYFELPDHAKRLIRKIAHGTTKLLKNSAAREEIKSLKRKAEEEELEPEQLNELQTAIQAAQSRIRECVTAIFKDLLRKHIETIYHSIFVAELCRDIAMTVNEELGAELLDPEILFYAGLWHDLGKHGIAQHVLSKPSKIHLKEFAHIKRHPLESVIKLAELIEVGDPDNVDIIVADGMHHLRDNGRRPGYPTIPRTNEAGEDVSLDVKGRQFFTEMPGWFSEFIEGLSEEQQDLFNNFTVLQKIIKDILAFADIIQALTGKRVYREQEGLVGLMGYINSNVGVDFPYYLARIITRMVNEGKMLRVLTYGEVGDGEATYDFPLPEGYEFDKLYEYMRSLDPDEFESTYGLNHAKILKQIEINVGKDLIISKRTLRADVFGSYMKVYGANKVMTELYFGACADEFVEEFTEWAGEPLDEMFEIERYKQWEEEAREAA